MDIDTFTKEISCNFILEKFQEIHKKNNPTNNSVYKCIFVLVQDRYFCFNDKLYESLKTEKKGMQVVKKQPGLTLLEKETKNEYYFSDDVLESCEIPKEYYEFCKCKYKHKNISTKILINSQTTINL